MRQSIKSILVKSLIVATSIVTVIGATLPLQAAQARGRYGSHRVGGYTSHGMGSHYVGGSLRSYRSNILPAPYAPNGTYTNSYGNDVPSPYYSASRPEGSSAQCADGTYSFSQHRSGTCSHHGGVSTWY